jgi:uncharacterized Zn-finger protein
MQIRGQGKHPRPSLSKKAPRHRHEPETDVEEEEEEPQQEASGTDSDSKGETNEYVCPIEWCDKRLPSASILQRHVATHDGRMCGLCNRPVKLGDSTPPRKRPTRPVQTCPLCPSVFSMKWSLILHMKQRHASPDKIAVETSDTLHKSCILCDRTFTKTSQLKRHMQTHTKVKPFPCPFCPKAYGDKRNQVSHMAKHHPTRLVTNQTDTSVRVYRKRKQRSSTTEQGEENNLVVG